MKKLLLLFLASASLANAAQGGPSQGTPLDELIDITAGQGNPRERGFRRLNAEQQEHAFNLGVLLGQYEEKKRKGFLNKVGSALAQGAERALINGTSDILYSAGELAVIAAYKSYKKSETPLSPEEQAAEKEIAEWTKKSEDVALRVAALKAHEQFMQLTALEAKLEENIKTSEPQHQAIMRKKAELAKKKAEEQAKAEAEAEALKVAMLEQQGTIPSAPAA